MALEIEIAAQNALGQLTQLNSKFDQLIKYQGPMVQVLDKLNMTFDRMSKQAKAQAKSSEQMSAASEKVSKSLKKEEAAVAAVAKAVEEGADSAERAEKIKKNLQTVDQRNAQLASELIKLGKQDLLTTNERARAYALMGASSEKVGTQAERMLASTQRQNREMFASKEVLAQMTKGFYLLSDSEQKALVEQMRLNESLRNLKKFASEPISKIDQLRQALVSLRQARSISDPETGERGIGGNAYRQLQKNILEQIRGIREVEKAREQAGQKRQLELEREKAHGQAIAEEKRRQAAIDKAHGQALAEEARRKAALDKDALRIQGQITTAAQRQAQVTEQLQKVYRSGRLTLDEYVRATEMLRVRKSQVGTEAERLVGKLQEEVDALGRSKTQTMELANGWRLLGEGQQQSARGSQALIDAYKALEGVLKPTLSITDQYYQKLAQLNMLRGAVDSTGRKIITERQYQTALKSLNDELQKNQVEEKKRNELLEKQRDPGLHSLRERIARMQEQNTLIPKTNEQLLRQHEAFGRLNKGEEENAIWTAKVADAQKVLGTAFRQSQAPLDRYKAKLDALAVAQRQYALTGGRQGVSGSTAAIIKAGAFRELLAAEVAANRATGAIGRLTGGLNLMNQTTAAARAAMLGAGQSFGIFTGSTLAVAGAVYTLAKAIRSSITVGAEFELSFRRTVLLMDDAQKVLAGMATTTSRMSRLIQTEIRRLAEATQYNLVETANAASVLARSGLNAAQVFVNLEPVLDLAAVGMLDVSKAAEISTGVMASFGEEAGALARYVEILAYTAVKSKATVEDLGTSMRYIGPIAANLGLSFEGTAAALATLSDVNIRGSMAGTALRRIFTNMLAPTAKGAEVMKKYGIEIDAATFSTEKFVEVLQKLQNASIGELKAISGQYAISSLVAMVSDRGLKKISELGQELQEVEGYAARVREELRGTFTLTLENLVSTFQNVQQAAFEAFGPGLTDKIRQLQKWVQTEGPTIANVISTVVNRLVSAVEWVIKFGKELGYLASAVASLKLMATVVGSLTAAYKALAVAVVAARAAQGLSAAGGSQSVAKAAEDARKLTSAMTAVGPASMLATSALTKVGLGARAMLSALGGIPGLIIGLGTILGTLFIPKLFEAEKAVAVLGGSLVSMSGSTEEAVQKLNSLSGIKFDHYRELSENALKMIPLIRMQLEEQEKADAARVQSIQKVIAKEKAQIQAIKEALPFLKQQVTARGIGEQRNNRYAMAQERLEEATRRLAATELTLVEAEQQALLTKGKLLELTPRQVAEQEVLRNARKKDTEEIAKQVLALNDYFEKMDSSDLSAVPFTERLQKILDLYRQLNGEGAALPRAGLMVWFDGMLSRARDAQIVIDSMERLKAAMEMPKGLNFEEPTELQAAIRIREDFLKMLQERPAEAAPLLTSMGKSAEEAIEALQGVLKMLKATRKEGETPPSGDLFAGLKSLLQEADRAKGSLSDTGRSLEGIVTAMGQLNSQGGAAILKEFGLSAEQAKEMLAGLGETKMFAFIEAELSRVDPRFKDFTKTLNQVEAETINVANGDEHLAKVLQKLNQVAPEFVRAMGGTEALFKRLQPAMKNTASGSAALQVKLKSLVEEGAKIQASLSIDTLDRLYSQFEEGLGPLGETEKTMIALVRANAVFGDSLKEALTPQEQFNEGQKLMNILVEKNILTRQQADRVLKDYTKNLSGSVEKLKEEIAAINGQTEATLQGAKALFIYNLAQQEVAGGLKAASEEWKRAAEALFEAQEKNAQAQQFMDSWKEFYEGLASAALDSTKAIRNYFKSMLEDLKRQLLASGLQALMGMLFGGKAPGGFTFTSQLGNMFGIGNNRGGTQQGMGNLFNMFSNPYGQFGNQAGWMAAASGGPPSALAGPGAFGQSIFGNSAGRWFGGNRGMSLAGNALGFLGGAYGVWDAFRNGPGGARGGLSGAASGAMAGTAIMPGIGTAIGAVIGGLAGLFGGKKKRPRIRINSSGQGIGNIGSRGTTALGSLAFNADDLEDTRGFEAQILEALQQLDQGFVDLNRTFRLGEEQLQALRSAAAAWSIDLRNKDIDPQTIIQSRFDALLVTFDEEVQEFTRRVEGFEAQMAALNDALVIRAAVDDGRLVDNFEDMANILERFRGEGEALGDTFERVLAATTMLEDAFEMTRTELDLGRVAFVEFANEFAEAAGGIERAGQLWGNFFERFFTASERTEFALTQARSNAGRQFQDIGLNYSDFAGEGGMQAFRMLFLSTLPTLGSEALVEWLEAAEAMGLVIDAQEAYTQALQEAGGALELNVEAMTAYANQVLGLQQQLTDLSAGSDYQRQIISIGRGLRDNIDALHEAARAAGLQAAREQDLAVAHELAALQAARALEQLMTAGRALARELYGTELTDVEDRIRAAEEAERSMRSLGGAIEEVAQTVSNSINLLLGDLSPLKDRQKLPLALQALERGEIGQEEVLQIGRRLFASGADYNQLFNQVMAIGDRRQQGGGGGGGVPSETETSASLRALYAERDALQAAQRQDERRLQALDLAQIIADIMGSPGGGSLEETLSLLSGGRGTLEQFATDLGMEVSALDGFIRTLQATTYSPVAIADALRTEFDRFLEGLRQILEVVDTSGQVKPTLGTDPLTGAPLKPSGSMLGSGGKPVIPVSEEDPFVGVADVDGPAYRAPPAQAEEYQELIEVQQELLEQNQVLEARIAELLERIAENTGATAEQVRESNRAVEVASLPDVAQSSRIGRRAKPGQMP